MSHYIFNWHQSGICTTMLTWDVESELNYQDVRSTFCSNLNRGFRYSLFSWIDCLLFVVVLLEKVNMIIILCMIKFNTRLYPLILCRSFIILWYHRWNVARRWRSGILSLCPASERLGVRIPAAIDLSRKALLPNARWDENPKNKQI